MGPREFINKFTMSRRFRGTIIDLVNAYEKVEFDENDSFKIIFSIPTGDHLAKYIIEKSIVSKRDMDPDTYLYNDGKMFNGTVYRTRIDSLADGDDEYIRNHAMFNLLGFCEMDMEICFCDCYDKTVFLKFSRY